MRVLGLIGGMSWESTVPYYRFVNERVRDKAGGLHSARILLLSVDFAEIEALQTSGDWATAGALLADAARTLEQAGAEALVLCTNTMHKVAPDIEAATSIPLLHIADTTAAHILAEGVRRVGLLGTAFTMEQDFYRQRLADRGLEVLVPDAVDRACVHQVIYDELCLGVVREESRQAYRDIMARLVAAGAEAIILGCTEICLLVGPDDTTVPTFDTTRLHAEGAADWSLGLPS
jgi:aspartate racemase